VGGVKGEGTGGKRGVNTAMEGKEIGRGRKEER
jgi:hypothetical protein